MTTLASNTVYQTLFTGQNEVYQNLGDNVLMNLDIPITQDNISVDNNNYIQQVCPVILNQGTSITNDITNELKTSETNSTRPVRQFECSYCHKHYFSETNLQLHLDVVHRGVRRFQCNFCGKAYAKGFLLKSHIKSVHENIRDVTCTICQKAFSKRSVMRRHMKSVHAEKKDFRCHLCQKEFTEKKNLQMHINALHKGLRPHQCDDCLKEFARKCDLLRHSNSVHRESKPYMCPICNKGFPQKWYFERHVASVHKKTPFPVSFINSRQQQQQQQSQPHPQLQQATTTITTTTTVNSTTATTASAQDQQQQSMQDALQHHLEQQQPPHQHLLQQQQQQQQQLRVLQSQPQNQTMNLPTGTILAAAHGAAHNPIVSGTQVMMVAPGMNMPMPAFFFQPQQAGSFTGPLAMSPHTAVLPTGTTSLFRPNCVATTNLNAPNSGALLTSPFAMNPIQMKSISVNPTQMGTVATTTTTNSRPAKEYQCSTCSKIYPRRQSLQAHIVQVHTDKKPYECNICHKGFVRRWDFYRHVNSVHHDNATLAIADDKLEEYVAWMRGRRSSLDISWECLNAVRPDLTRIKSDAASPQSSLSQTATVVIPKPEQLGHYLLTSDVGDANTSDIT